MHLEASTKDPRLSPDGSHEFSHVIETIVSRALVVSFHPRRVDVSAVGARTTEARSRGIVQQEGGQVCDESHSHTIVELYE